jgi:DNA-binding LacI/PurR family transcriptional regulator/DNA-binding transcriptional ArsR family regulator
MSELKILSISEQIAQYLRGELANGRWSGALPGRFELAKQLGVGISSMEEALRQLERDGVLESQGVGRMRRIAAPGKSRSLRVKILLYESIDRGLPDEIELLARLREAGHIADFAPKSMHDLGMRADKVARFVEKHPADAWVVSSGSREILEWFSSQSIPAFANYGRFRGLQTAAASAQKTTALASALHRMKELGHRRIVMLSREERRKPAPGLFERYFLNELAALGLQTGAYNLPHWDDHPAGLRACLDSLFRHTPPTALIVCEMQIFQATQQYLARRGILIPEHVSVLCTYPDLTFEWCDPAISHIRWDQSAVLRRVLGWAKNVARGKTDLRQTSTPSEFIDGGTIGPVKTR